MDTETYTTQMETTLGDKNTHETLKKDPMEEKNTQLKALLKPLLEQQKTSQDMYNYLIPTANTLPWIYGTPNIHKKDTPLRPFVDSISSIKYNLSKVSQKGSK